ncbi:MAG: FAD-binding protein [Alphaproteobacteria bacterium]|nr:FAD-binding protein [Alphaproteobacteria bacterium]
MGLTRRQLLIAGGAVSAAIGIPAGQQIAWSLKDFTRPGYDPTPPSAPAGRMAWTNWSGIERATPKQIAVPADEAALADLVRAARGRVRAAGSGHSFTGLVPCEDIIVDVSRLSGLVAHDAQKRIVTFGAGTRLHQAAREMAAVGLAWPNQPDIDIQTLAGSFATATHGAGLKLKALHDQVIGFRFVTASGDIRDVTRESDPDLFAAGKVSLGALGVVTQVTMKMAPSFALRRRVWADRIEALLEQAEELASTHRNFELYFLPHTGLAAAISHDIYEGPLSGRAQSEDDELLLGLKKLRDSLGWQPWLRRKFAEASLPRGVVEDDTDESWRLLSTARPIKFNEMEYHLPHEEGVRGLRAVLKALDRRKETYFPIEMRWTGRDDAMLSPFNDGPRVSIACHAAVSEPYDYFFKDIEPLHRARGGRPHWGKLHSLGYAELSGLYPDFDRFCEIRRALDPDGKFLNPFLAKLFGERFNG